MKAPKQMRCDHERHTVDTEEITIRIADMCGGRTMEIVGVNHDGTEMSPHAIATSLDEAVQRAHLSAADAPS